MGRGREGKICLIKNIMLRGDDVVGGEIKTPIVFVVNDLGASLWAALAKRLG
jgi:hypothetical protein